MDKNIIRCSAVVVRVTRVLLLQRRADWVLPGGEPNPGESVQSCARREVYEEAGLEITTTSCVFVFEVIPPDRSTRAVEITFRGDLIGDELPELCGEEGRRPQWVEMDAVPRLNMRPPLAGYLRRATSDRGPAYLGNQWRS
jgi:8-oxo-dGTP diphosphatase